MKAETLRSTLGLLLVMLLCYFLQSAVFSRLRIFGFCPLLLPLVAVGAGLLGSSGWGGGFGLLCGILCDAALGGGGMLFTVALTVLVAIYYLARWAMRSTANQVEEITKDKKNK